MAQTTQPLPAGSSIIRSPDIPKEPNGPVSPQGHDSPPTTVMPIPRMIYVPSSIQNMNSSHPPHPHTEDPPNRPMDPYPTRS